MEPSEAARITRARRAYEAGRLRGALRAVIYVAPAALLSLAADRPAALTAALTGLLFAVCAALLWRGRAWGRAVGPGLLAGAAPLALPILARSGGHCCIGGYCWSICLATCVAGGLCAGGLLAYRVRAERGGRGPFLLGATTVAVLVGSLGCAMAGAAGVVGMLVGVVVGSTPVVVGALLRGGSRV